MQTTADEEKQYYLLVEKVFRVLAPFYDLVTIPLARVRNTVVDFADAESGSRILDVATGTGEQALAFARRGYEVVGVDISEAMLKVARKKNRHGHLRFEASDATNLPFENGSFDVTCVSFALHDMPLTVGARALKEMVRVTRPTGLIVVVDYALPKSKVGRFLVYHFVRLYEREYYSRFIESDLEALLTTTGIEIGEELPVLLGAARILRGRITGQA